MDPLLIALAVAALLIGATGTWSPCGFSMIETIGPTGHTGGLPTTFAAAATFAPAAVLGGLLTYGLLALAGEALIGAAGSLAYALAAALVLAAALAEARGTPIVPQVRRQLPVAWRSRMPMPLAAAGYGVLLGLGFTTFVLSYGVWALMGVSLAIADPAAGAVVGVAFGLGRAIPIVVLAPLADRPSGERACETMALRPGLLRGARFGDAMALIAVAGALLAGAGTAGASGELEPTEKAVAANGSDPSVAGPILAYEARPAHAVLVREPGERTPVPGTDPAIGGPWIAVIHQGRVEVMNRSTLEVVGSMQADGADGLGVSRSWIAVRRRDRRGDSVVAAPLSDAGAIGSPVAVTRVKSPGQLSNPAVSGSAVVFARSRPGSSALLRAKLRAGGSKPRKLIKSKRSAFTGPSVAGSKIAYVETTTRRQIVRIKKAGGGKGRKVTSRGPGPPTLWTTALAAGRVYVTLVSRGGRGSLIAARR